MANSLKRRALDLALLRHSCYKRRGAAFGRAPAPVQRQSGRRASVSVRAEAPTAAAGDFVSVHYTGTLDDGAAELVGLVVVFGGQRLCVFAAARCCDARRERRRVAVVR